MVLLASLSSGINHSGPDMGILLESPTISPDEVRHMYPTTLALAAASNPAGHTVHFVVVEIASAATDSLVNTPGQRSFL
jgi:hypothetical protein